MRRLSFRALWRVFDLSRSRTVAAVEAAMLRDGLIFLVAQKDPEEIDPGETGIYRYGTLCQIRSLTRTSHNTRRAVYRRA